MGKIKVIGRVAFLSFGVVVTMLQGWAVASTCGGGQVRFSASSNQLYVAGPAVCTLSEIKTMYPSAPLELVDPAKKIWHLRTNLVVERGASLVLHGTAIGGDVNELRLQSDNSSAAGSFVYLRADWGNVSISGTKITSWDAAARGPDVEYAAYGRAYIHVRSRLDTDGVTAHESRMDIVNSDVSYLGYPADESYGLAWKVSGSAPGLYDKVNVLGNIKNSKVHHNYFGIYTYGAYGMAITGNEVHSNVQYGVDPHDDSDSLTIAHNNVHHNGGHGVICSQRCDHLTISNNESHHNAGVGIMVHRNANDSLLENNALHDNGDAGIAIFDSHRDTVRGNNSYNNLYGLRFSEGSSHNIIENNSLSNNTSHGILFYKGTGAPTVNNGRPSRNRLTGNTINNNTGYAVQLREGDDNVFGDNKLLDNKGGGIQLYSAKPTGNQFTGNELRRNVNYGFDITDAPATLINNNTIDRHPNGVYLLSTTGANVKNNKISNSVTAGVTLDKSANNSVTGNTFTANAKAVVQQNGSSDNAINGNNIN